MKDLKHLVNNFKAPAQQNNALTDNVVIDDFAKNIINKVFDQLAVIFPAWKHAWGSDRELSNAKMEWTKAFNENGINTLEQVKHGFLKARRSGSDFLPSCGKFIAWCEPSAEDYGYPSEEQALRACIKHRNALKIGIDTNTRQFIKELTKRVDWFLMNSASNQVEHKKANQHFKDVYKDFIASGYQEPLETTSARLETSEVVNDRMTPEQLEDKKQRGLDAMREVKLKLRKANKQEL